MDIVKLLIFLGAILTTSVFSFNNQKLLLFSVGLLFAEVLLRATSSNNAALQTATLLLLVATGILTSLILRGQVKSNTSRKTVIFYFVLLGSILVHNLYDIMNMSDRNYEIFMNNNPWGLLICCLFVFLYNSNISSDIIYHPYFRRMVIATSFIIFALLVLVMFGVIEGNSDKLSQETGGVGLLNHSTNETALFALSLSVYLLHYFRRYKNNKIFMVAILVNMATIVLTRSRIGIGLTMFVIASYSLTAFLNNPGRSLLIAMIVLLCLMPVLDIIIDVVNKRFANDTAEDYQYGVLADQLGFTLSGRIFIWEAYVSEFLNMASKQMSLLYFGGGFSNIIAAYKASFLPLLGGFEVKKGNFFPVHSDLIFMFMYTGVAGIFCWVRLAVAALVRSLKSKSHLSISFSVILILFSCFDMLNYTYISSILIGLGINSFKST